MAEDWRDIPDAEITAGKRILALTALALRDRVEGLAAAVEDAPGISFFALGRAVAAGDTTRWLDPTQYTLDTATFVERFSYRFLQSGAVRVKVGHFRSSGSGAHEMRILKNGVVLNTYSTTSPTLVTEVLDVPISQGDTVSVEHRMTVVNIGGVQNFEIATDGAALYPPIDDRYVF